MGREKEIEKTIIQFIRLNGWWCQKVHSGVITQAHKLRTGQVKVYKVKLADAGTPDVLACIKGQFVGIEVKKDDEAVQHWLRHPKGKNGKPIKPDERIMAQKHQKGLIKRAGGYHIVCASINELRDDLKTLGLI